MSRPAGSARMWGLPRAGGGRAAATVEHSRAFQLLVRVGFLARALTYGVIGGLTLAMALGAGTLGAAPDQQGALSLLARAWLGRIALIVVAAGLIAYAVWKLIQGVRGRGPEGGGGSSAKDRIANLAGCAVYVAFAGVAVQALAGGAGNSSSAPKHATAGVLGWPGGQPIVALAGATLVAISLFQVYEAVTGAFAEDNKTSHMGADEKRLFLGLGRVGLSARALVFVLVGYFLIRAAIDFNPQKAVSLDGVLARLHHEPLGPWLLGLVAAGLLVFAVYSVFEARYRQL